MGQVKTYNPRQVTVSLGNHAVSGFADDGFVEIEPLGDGITSQSGCDGEVARAIDPNQQYGVKLSLLQTSDSNAYLQSMYDRDRTTGGGAFDLLIQDLRGNTRFHAASAWVVKPATRSYGKDTNNREWELETSYATIEEGTYSS